MVLFKLHLTLTALEDLHIGNGLSHLGEYDSGQATDSRGTPWVPTSTLVGMIREGCRKVMLENPDTKFQGYFDELFNFSKGDSLVVEPLRLKGPQVIVEAPFIVLPYTEVGLTGTAKSHSLRSVQCVKRGAIFKGDIYGNVSEDGIISFLKDGVQRVREIGGNRNRGTGKIEWDVDPEKILPSFGFEIPGLNPSPLQENTPSYLMLRFRLKDHVTIGAQGQANNLQFSRDYIRSENIVGAFRHVMRTILLPHLENGQTNRNALPESMKLLDDEDENPIFSNLYPMPTTRNPKKLFAKMTPFSIIPFPKSLRLPKSLKSSESSEAASPLKELPLWFTPSMKPKSQKGKGFVWYKAVGDFEIIDSPLMRVLRNRVDEQRGVVMENALFTEEGLRDDAGFLGWIYFQDDIQKHWFESLFSSFLPQGKAPARLPLAIGRGRKMMVIEQTKSLPGITPDKDPQSKSGGAETERDFFNLFFLSDALFLDKTGQGAPMLTSDLLKDYLGVTHSDPLLFINRAESSYAYIPMHSNGGFFTPGGTLIEKGSVYQIKKDTAGREVFKLLKQRRAIGENQQKGYGLFAIDHPINDFHKKPLKPSDDRVSEQENRLQRAETFYGTLKNHLPKERSIDRRNALSINRLTSFLMAIEYDPTDKSTIKEKLARLEKRKNTEGAPSSERRDTLSTVLENHLETYGGEQLACSIRYGLAKHSERKAGGK